VEQLGRLDVLFNNAGIVRRASVVTTTEAEWDQVMAVNVKSIFLMSKYAVPVMERQGSGAIINTASGWGLKGGFNAVAYCASKGAVVNMTRAMAIDHGPHGIRVNCVCPGDRIRPRSRGAPARSGVMSYEVAKRPLKYYGQPLEIVSRCG
jgi:NAD(P)-dependent dehydrogenase (short-subunit alcohol dehydrogenase family)